MLSFALPQLGQNPNNCLSPSATASHSTSVSSAASPSSLPLQPTASRFAAGRFSKSFVFIGNKVGGGSIEGLCHMSHALIYISKSKQLTVLLRNPTIPTRECNNNQKKRDRERVSSSIFRSFFRLRAHIIKNNKNLRRF